MDSKSHLEIELQETEQDPTKNANHNVVTARSRGLGFKACVCTGLVLLIGAILAAILITWYTSRDHGSQANIPRSLESSYHLTTQRYTEPTPASKPSERTHTILRSLHEQGVTITTSSSLTTKGSSSTSAVPVIVKWSRWGPWDDCSQTCGGGKQVRTRTCESMQALAVNAVSPTLCAGKAKQNRTCADWSCPDCSKPCPRGTLNSACDACTCNDHILTGKVLTKDGIPLPDAKITLAETPYNVLAQTNASGHFLALNVCSEVQLFLVTQDGFVPTFINSTIKSPSEANVDVKMEFAVAPSVAVHPVSKMRISGQSATFCCKGEGHPPPNIEWFRNGNILDTELSRTEGTLHIADVHGLDGSYQCRAINDFGAEFSDTAALTVVDPVQDTCKEFPDQKNISLPAGCTVRGTTNSTVEIGECKPAPCLRNDSNITNTCNDPTFCCAPKKHTQIEIQCGRRVHFNVSQVLLCGCSEQCAEQETFIQGEVTGPEGSPMRYGDVVVGGKVSAYTDADGFFSIKVSEGTRRMTITFVDTFEELEDVTKVFMIQEGQINFYKISLPTRQVPVPFNASEPIDIPLGHSSENQSSFAEVEIPANSLLSEDGTLFTGQANLRMSVTDPRNETDVQLAPGDFTAVDEDGEQQMLQTFGMIKMNFEDENKKPLAMSKPMKIFIDPEQVNMTVDQNGNVSAKLYWLDDQTGRWREAGNIWAEDGSGRRRKRDSRQFIVAEISVLMSKKELNFDAPNERCGVRIKADSGSTVRIFGLDKGYVQGVVPTSGILCIPTWKDTTCYMQVEKNGVLTKLPEVSKLPSGIDAEIIERGKTGIKSLKFQTSIANDGNGPIYLVTDHENCKSSKKPHKAIEFSHQVKEVNKLASTFTNHQRTWDRIYGGKKKCYIRVKILANYALSFTAESFPEGWNGAPYGLSTGTSIETKQSGEYITCLEYRCSGKVDQKEQFTYVIVSPLTGNCKSFNKKTDMHDALLNGQNKCAANAGAKSKEQVVSFCVPHDPHNQDFYRVYTGDAKIAWKGCMMDINLPRINDINKNVKPGKKWVPAEQVRSGKGTLTYDCR